MLAIYTWPNNPYMPNMAVQALASDPVRPGSPIARHRPSARNRSHAARGGWPRTSTDIARRIR